MTLPIKVFINAGNGFDKVDLSPYNIERSIESTIIQNPELIPIDIIDLSGKEFIPISSQCETTHGPLDIIGTDDNGWIYIIETKLYKNHHRREIAAQAWDYGAGLATIKDTFEEFEECVKKANKSKPNIGTNLQNLEIDDVISQHDLDYREKVKENLKKNFEKSDFTYILVLDEVDEKLKDFLKHHNEKSKNLMYAVTLSEYTPKGSKNKIIISDVFGTESAKKSRDTRNYEKWKQEGEKEFKRLIHENTDLKTNHKKEIKKFLLDVKKILGNKTEAKEKEGIGYYAWGNSAEPNFEVRLYGMGYSKNRDFSRIVFKLKPNGSIRFYIIGHTKSITKKFCEKWIKELRNISDAKELIKKIDSGTKEPLWSADEWIPCRKELFEIIKKSPKYDKSLDLD